MAANLVSQLRAERNRWHATIDAMVDPVATCDASGRVDYINPAYEQRLGKPARPSLPFEAHPEYYQLFHPDGTPFAPEDRPLQRAAFTGNDVRDVEVMQRTAAGDDMLLLFNASPLKDAEGRVIGAVAVGRDVTALRRAETAAALANRLLQGIVDNSPSIVYALDTEERFILANDALGEVLAIEPREMLGKRRHSLMPREDAEWHEANDRHVFESGKALQFEEYSNLPDRNITWLTSKFPLRDSQGNIYAVGGISADVTERKRAEQALKDALDAKDEFLGLVSHELRTPATTVTGLSRFLVQHVQTMAPEDVLDTLKTVSRDADRLQSLILNMLALARLERSDVVLEPILIRQTIAKAIRDYIERNPDREVRFQPPCRAIPVLGYGPWIGQVVENLLSNAHKYSPPGTSIEIRIWREGEFAVVAVRDHGPGIAREDLDKIFTPFERTEWAKSAASGLGLGLSVCQRLIAEHGGSIRVHLPKDGGTEMRFTLPVVEDEPEA